MSTSLEKSIFLSALDCATASERERCLSEACGDDLALRRSVERLLELHERSGHVLDEIPGPVDSLRMKLDGVMPFHGDVTPLFTPRAPTSPANRTGESVDNYRLLELIGEGGFGEVYVAEQQQPVRRRVALKLLRPGMDSREVIARFEAERQALAMMDHPHIARVFDAGTTRNGQPYFVMELVRGVPITRFCDQRQSSTRERLELFVDVCQAVQHAHQKGIIHRDLKPSNVMVTLHDSIPVVKVIDFGVAKAIQGMPDEPLTQKTLYTRFAQMIGTPLYMSPEQAEMSGLDVDTRSDIYSLGVMLYELLTGTTPFDHKRLNTATFDELRQIIREEEPPRPSARLTTLADAATTQATRRRADYRALATMLRGDLDWVVMKALEKDRRRRYPTAADLAEDVRRFLDQQPVIARPPSRWYRLSKFARRNKVAFTTAFLVLLSLVAGTAVSTWQAVRATRAQAEADALRQEAVDFATRLKEANILLDSARANADEQRWGLALSQYTTATQLQPEHYLVWSGRGSLYVRLGLWHLAAKDFAKALELGAPANNPLWWGIPHLFLYTQDSRSYRKSCALLHEQIQQSQDPGFLTFAIRSLSAAAGEYPIDREELARRAREVHPFGPPDRLGFGVARREGPGRREGTGRTSFPHKLIRDFVANKPGLRIGPAGLEDYLVGLTQLRTGNYQEAIRRLREMNRPNDPGEFYKLGFPALAMAEHAAGQSEQAEQVLAEASQALDQWTSALVTGSPESLPFPWFDFIEFVVLYREAHLQLTGQLPSFDRLDESERRALAALNDE
jgi:serine/threonine protein kinase